MLRLGHAVVFILAGWLLGCATWDTPESHQEWKLPTPVVSADAITFETAFIRWPHESTKTGNDLWHGLDEQCLSPELRQHLAANGLRAGIAGDPLPEAIRLALEETRDPLAIITDQNATPGAEVLTRRERRQCSSGTTIDIEVLPLAEGERVVLFNDLGRVRADRFDQPRGIFRFQPRSLGDGRIRAELRPIIDYGERRQRYIGGQGAYRFDTQREQSSYESLSIPVPLAPGQTLVVTATSEPIGLGAALFADRFDASPDRLLMLIRLAATQQDDLFGNAPRTESLVTPLE